MASEPAALVYLFFFSSRRRHTRSLCDWSSDVCSSDLAQTPCVCKESFELLVEHIFEVNDGDFVVALPAQVFGRIGPGIHLPAAIAPCELAEGLGGQASRLFP